MREFENRGEWDRLGTGHGAFTEVAGVALAPTRNIYVSDQGSNCIQHFTAGGSFLGK